MLKTKLCKISWKEPACGRIFFAGAAFLSLLLNSNKLQAQSTIDSSDWSDWGRVETVNYQSQPSPVVSTASFRETQLRAGNLIAPNSCDDHSCCDIAWGAKPERESSLTSGWSIYADALFLHRQTPDSRVLVLNTDNTAQDLNANDFRLGVHTGFDLSLTRQINNVTGVELRYFGFEHWSASATEATTPGDLLQINSALPIFTLAGDAIAADYQSKLHNAEASLVRQVTENISLFGGFRYLELDERGQASLINPGIPFNYQVSARNRLSGFQLGSKLHLWEQGGVFSLGATGKAGIYGNSASQNSSIDTGLVTLTSRGRGSNTAFVGELGVLGKLHLTERLAIRGGYNLLWLTDLALASDQLAVSDFTAETGFTSRAGLFYHGANAGLELNW